MPVEDRHVQVEEHDVGKLLPRPVHGLGPVGGLDDGELVAQHAGQQPADRRVVVGNEHHPGTHHGNLYRPESQG
jgi:hypothetical protein